MNSSTPSRRLIAAWPTTKTSTKPTTPGLRLTLRPKPPGLDWAEYFRGAGISEVDSFMVWQPEAFTGESALVASTALDTWKDWLAFHLIEAYAGVLPKGFCGRTLCFFRQDDVRHDRAASALAARRVSGGRTAGRRRRARSTPSDIFRPKPRRRPRRWWQTLIAAFRKRIEALSWMDPATKAEAQAKLSTLYVGVGYPETWHDYSSL